MRATVLVTSVLLAASIMGATSSANAYSHQRPQCPVPWVMNHHGRWVCPQIQQQPMVRRPPIVRRHYSDERYETSVRGYDRQQRRGPPPVIYADPRTTKFYPTPPPVVSGWVEKSGVVVSTAATPTMLEPKPPTKNGEVFQYETTAALMSGKDCGQKDYCVEVPFQSYWVKGKDGVTYNFRDCTDTPNAGNGKVVTCQQVGGGREKMKFAHDNTGNLRDVRVIR